MEHKSPIRYRLDQDLLRFSKAAISWGPPTTALKTTSKCEGGDCRRGGLDLRHPKTKKFVNRVVKQGSPFFVLVLLVKFIPHANMNISHLEMGVGRNVENFLNNKSC